ncbi:NAD(P)/FAD-dependent oxidoreductase [Phaeobacter sp.]|uniref:flavin-containing monooxygenase n=1 Tax=Phaeobacter sp. TaxID=1902409 RepID=UPI0025EC120B|nr:NAD(P)/FAD-dependent oxidoreductase [Phaeobacter sp.]
MTIEQTDVLVIGAGQAGVAASEHLSKAGIKHLVLERDRIAEKWRTGRWDSLVANGPAWHDRFPNLEFTNHHDDAFVPKDQVAQYFVDYAKQFDAPIREGVQVTDLSRKSDGAGFVAQTSAGTIESRYVISATGAFQNPIIPPILPEIDGITQMHSIRYRNPQDLPEGNVLVVGAGSSGVQIATEIMQSGRKTFLSVGSHDRPPRRYRGRDFVWWLGVLNLWDAEASPASTHTTIAVTGADGGYTVDFRELASQGMTLLGLTERYTDGRLSFADNLVQNIKEGDENYLATLDLADDYVRRNRLDLPEDPEARIIAPDPECVSTPIRSIDLAEEGITTVIWATGFGFDYSWLNVDALDDAGRPAHKRGVSTEPNFYFLGLPWQSRRGSSFIWGVWHDAKFIVDHIAKQEGYLAYRGAAKRLMAEQQDA